MYVCSLRYPERNAHAPQAESVTKRHKYCDRRLIPFSAGSFNTKHFYHYFCKYCNSVSKSTPGTANTFTASSLAETSVSA